MMGEIEGWQMKANPFIEATARMLLKERSLKDKYYELRLEMLRGIENMMTKVALTSAPRANGLS